MVVRAECKIEARTGRWAPRAKDLTEPLGWSCESRGFVLSDTTQEQEERDAVDLMTDSVFAIDFLQMASDDLRHGGPTRVSELHELVKKRNGRTDRIIPYNLGAVLGFLYVGMLYPKERFDWFDLVPDDPLPNSDPDWGLRKATVIAAKKPCPTVRYCIRRLRNSLGHTSFVYNVPKVLLEGQNVFEAVTIRFRDHNSKDPFDTFEVVLNLVECVKLTAKFRQTVHAHVRKKHGL